MNRKSVYLVVPTLNDGDAEVGGLARWIKTNLGVDVPVHFTQFHPEYLLKNLPIIPVPTLERAKAIADAEGLHYVYIGNVPGHPAQNTYCPKCHRMLVERVGFTASRMLIPQGQLPILPGADPWCLARMSGEGGFAYEYPAYEHKDAFQNILAGGPAHRDRRLQHCSKILACC